SLPKSLPAIMCDGTYMDASVSWYPSTVDTSKPGIINYSGTIQGYASKVTLSLTVNPVISSIKNLSVAILQNGSYTLPQTVSAIMSDGAKKEFPVTWDSNIITSKIGTSTYTGTVQGYSNKVTLTLEVKEGFNFFSVYTPDSDDAYQDTPYSLPKTAIAYQMDRTYIDVPISWSPSTVDLSQTGSFNYVGTVEGWDKKLTLTLNVCPPILSVYNPSDIVYQGDSYDLPSGTSVELEKGKYTTGEVSWSPSTVDTSRVGVFTYVGSIKNSTAKSYFTITVKSKTSYNDISMSVDQNQSFSFPKTITAHSIDGISKEVPITWNATSVDTSVCGYQTFEGTVDGYDGKVKLSLYVRGPGMVFIPDSNLEAAIRDALSIPTGDITENDMLKISSLFINSKKVNTLEGIQYAKNLKSLTLVSTSIEDISQLAGLTQLNSLSIGSNKIKSISSLSNLVNLTSLSASDNLIKDISPLSNLTKLTSIDLTRDKINDISALRNLTNLDSLSLGQCDITDIIVLSGLTKLTSLRMNYNYISDITPLIGLVNLTTLDLADNLIDDYTPLASLPKLQNLDISGNHLRDFSKYTLFNDNIKINFWGLDQTKAEIVAFLNKADEIIASVTTPGMTPLEIERALHDYICTHTVYTLGINQGAYGILVLGKGSCNAYADAMNLLLNRAGIYCIKVHGYYGTLAHAWNIVMIDGKYYQLDVTWDTCNTEEDGALNSKYFNVNDEFMLTERTWETSKYPACN
ncbi:MAG TPA: Ig-like domain-containing protein, partial [Lachnospiraceae bacterium]|nr:Ig-like domain-containing protein [Lachnospiraceae bacterium]